MHRQAVQNLISAQGGANDSNGTNDAGDANDADSANDAGDSNGTNGAGEADVDIEIASVEVEPKIKPPEPYRVVMIDDDFTPMEFVVILLCKFFHKTEPQATEIMMQIHNYGEGICGIYPYDIAQTKAELVMQSARKHEFPLLCRIEKN